MGSRAPLCGNQPVLCTPLREAIPASIGHFLASARRCLNQKRRECAVEFIWLPRWVSNLHLLVDWGKMEKRAVR
jgi:hypothetical protein